MKIQISSSELDTRINKNFEKLHDSYYSIENIFDGDDADWPGDKEGRALLAFVCHYKMTSRKIPCMELMIEQIPEATAGKLYFGHPSEDVLLEQQLSGESWYLRGLCEYYEQFGNEKILTYLDKTFNEVYLPTKGRFCGYPVNRLPNADGGVSGHTSNEIDGWKLSTDIGCAFMSLDGLSHYYKLTENPKAKELIDEMAGVFDKIDKVKLQAQTHCTLTAGRGLVRMYETTGESGYLEKAKKIFDIYTEKGMTYTYQNFNWFGKGDTWTEPCAIVDSLILALMLYKITGKEAYRTYAARIYHNGFASMQRPNGGAGTDTCVSNTTDTLEVGAVYEAFFCCSMRLAEGLWFISQNKALLYADTCGTVSKDSCGRYTDGDIIYAQIPEEFEAYAEKSVTADGKKLFPLIKFYKLNDEEMCRRACQKIIFK